TPRRKCAQIHAGALLAGQRGRVWGNLVRCGHGSASIDRGRALTRRRPQDRSLSDGGDPACAGGRTNRRDGVRPISGSDDRRLPVAVRNQPQPGRCFHGHPAGSTNAMTNDRHVDLLVLGSGAAGMTAALTASVLGLDVLVVEKTEVVGGTTARSAGSLWVPNSRHSPPGRDNPDNALRYLRAVLGNRFDETRVRAFLGAAPEMVAFLEDNTAVALRASPPARACGATVEGPPLSGGVLEPVPFDASVLGSDFAKLRPPLPEFMLLGGMMVDRIDIGHLLDATRSLAS